MTDRLADIKILWAKGSPVKSTIYPENVDWLIAEVDRLRTLELEREKNLHRITELGQEIEILQRNHADGLKVTGISHG